MKISSVIISIIAIIFLTSVTALAQNKINPKEKQQAEKIEEPNSRIKVIDDVDIEMEVEKKEEPVFTIVEEMPEFPGGMNAMREYLIANIIYPANDKKNGTTGTSYISFIVNTDGSIKDVKIYPGTAGRATEAMHKEAIRVIEAMPKWKAGRQRGKAVMVSYMVPIQFKL